MNGLLIVDKPPELTSFDVVRKVRGRLRRLGGPRKLKVGHAGTLDPFATGVLLVCVGVGTRLSRFLTEAHKTYRVTMRLGQTTNTDDCDGEVLETAPIDHLTPEQVRAALESMRGDSLQRPPAFSAIHVDGVRAYKLARRGEEVELEPRPIHVSRLEISDVSLPDVAFDVTASKGTYVRAICRDVGAQLGVGAHCVALRRLSSSGFDIARAVPLAAVLDDWTAADVARHLISPLEMLHQLHPIDADLATAKALTYGQRPAYDGELEVGAVARVAYAGRLIAVAEVIEGGALKVVRAMPADALPEGLTS